LIFQGLTSAAAARAAAVAAGAAAAAAAAAGKPSTIFVGSWETSRYTFFPGHEQYNRFVIENTLQQTGFDL
jgi:hypothetical protein